LEVLHDVWTRNRVHVREKLALIALLGAVAGCGDAPRETPADTALATPGAGDTAARDTGTGDTGTVVDTGAASTPVREVLLVLAADSASGDAIFNRRGTCFTCHGERGVGMPSLGPDLRDDTWLNGDGSFRSILRVIDEGVAVPKASPIGMPSFEGRLSETERYRVAAYVFSLSHPGAVVMDTTTSDTLSVFTLPPSPNQPR
jgi:mono/diheme cytochrome c family protein